MRTQSTDGEAVVVQLLLELLQLLLVLNHRELAMRITWIIAGTEFNSVDVKRFKLL